MSTKLMKKKTKIDFHENGSMLLFVFWHTGFFFVLSFFPYLKQGDIIFDIRHIVCGFGFLLLAPLLSVLFKPFVVVVVIIELENN